MKLYFLGSGAAFDISYHRNYHSNMLICTDHGKNLLIDCGSDARYSLTELGFSYKDIDALYISHLHADHTGGIEWLALSRYFDPACTKSTLFIAETLAPSLWEHTLSGGLTTLQEQTAKLASYFEIHPVSTGCSFKWEHVEGTLIQTIHVISNSVILPTHGLFLAIPIASNVAQQLHFDKRTHMFVFITTDTIFSPELYLEHYKKADVIFHDCETTTKASTVHARYAELITLPLDIKQKMWLYHYNEGILPNAQADGFRGFVKKGQCFDFNDPKSFY